MEYVLPAVKVPRTALLCQWLWSSVWSCSTSMAWPRRSSPRPSTACAGKTPEQLPALDFISIARFGDVPLFFFFSFLPFSVSLKDPLQCIIPHCLWLLGVFSNTFLSLLLCGLCGLICSLLLYLLTCLGCLFFPLHPPIFHPLSPRSTRGINTNKLLL